MTYYSRYRQTGYNRWNSRWNNVRPTVTLDHDRATGRLVVSVEGYSRELTAYMKTALPKFARYWSPTPARRADGSWMVVSSYAADVVAALRRMPVTVLTGAGYADPTPEPDVPTALYRADDGRWHDRRDDVFPGSLDPDRCSQCHARAAVNQAMLCSACDPGDPSWPDSPAVEETTTETVWLDCSRVSSETFDEVLTDNPGLTLDGWAEGSEPDFAERRAALAEVPLDRLGRLAFWLTDAFPTVVEIHQGDALELGDLIAWLAHIHPELGEVLPGELGVAALAAGYVMTVADEDGTPARYYVGMPAEYARDARAA